MSDIFISYSRRDVQRVEALAAMLEQAGWSVWWDRHIKGGSSFDKLIEGEIQQARAVVVVWSRESVHSDWVRAEAAFALDRSKLVPVRLDASAPPLRFTNVQTLDLSGWDGRALTSDAMRRLLADLTALIGAPPNATAARVAGAVRPRRPARNALLIAVAALLLSGGAVLAWRAGLWHTPPPLAAPVAQAPAAPALDILDQDMVVVRDAPLRVAPEIAAQQVGMVAAGRRVHVAGRVRDSAWYAIQSPDGNAAAGAALSYVASAALADPATLTAQKAKSPQSAGAAAVAPRVTAPAPPPVSASAEPVVIATATAPPGPAAAAPAAVGFDGIWKGYLRCDATKDLPATTNNGTNLEIIGGQLSGAIPPTAGGPNAQGKYWGRVFPGGAVNINGTVTNARRGNYKVTLRGRIEGDQMRASGFVGGRQCVLNYSRQ